MEIAERATLDPDAIKVSLEPAPTAAPDNKVTASYYELSALKIELENFKQSHATTQNQILQLENAFLFPEVYELNQKMGLVWKHLDFGDVPKQNLILEM